MKFSVVIPVYNGLNFLGDAIESLFQQTYKNYEIIIVDDASTEDIFNFLVKNYLEFLGNKIIYVRNCQSKERCWSRNQGIDIASGDLITFLDHDDRFKQHHLQTLHDVFQNKDVEVVYSNPEELIDYENNLIGLYDSKLDDHDLVKSALTGAFCVIGFAFRKDTLCKIGKFNLETIQREDYELGCRTTIKYKLVIKVIHSNSIQIRRIKSKLNIQSALLPNDPYLKYSKKVQNIIEGYTQTKLLPNRYLSLCYIEVINTAIVFNDLAYAIKLLGKSLYIYPLRRAYLKLFFKLIRSLLVASLLQSR